MGEQFEHSFVTSWAFLGNKFTMLPVNYVDGTNETMDIKNQMTNYRIFAPASPPRTRCSLDMPVNDYCVYPPSTFPWLPRMPAPAQPILNELNIETQILVRISTNCHEAGAWLHVLQIGSDLLYIFNQLSCLSLHLCLGKCLQLLRRSSARFSFASVK